MKKSKPLVITAVLLLCIALLGWRSRPRIYTSAADYSAANGKMMYSLPEQAENCRFLIQKHLIGKFYIYGFSLSAADADAYTASLVREYKLDSTDENDQKYGYAHWYGKTAAECAESEYELEQFPIHMPFFRITDRDIASAKILVYLPYNTGSRCSGILRFPDSGEFICFYAVSK